MGYDQKYGQVTTERGSIPVDEPVIVFRAQDTMAPGAVYAYLTLCKQGGASEVHIDGVRAVYEALIQWQNSHPGQVKIPDTTREQVPE